MTNRKNLAVLAVLALALSACGGTTKSSTEGQNTAAPTNTSAKADPNAPLKEGLKIAYLPKQLNNPYTDVEVGGGKVAVGELKGEYKLVGPNDASASSQVSYINTLIQQQQNVIVVAANDPNAVCPSLNQARKAGIKVVTFDSDAAKTCRDAFINQATTQGIGESLVKMASELAGGSGEIAILSATPNATNQNSWIEVMKTELAKPENAKLKLVKIAYGNDDDQKSFTEAQGLLQSYPNLKVIVSPTTVGIAAASRYVSASNYKGKVAITGLGLPNQMRKFVKDGTVKKFALWNPADIGYLAAYAGASLSSGQITGAQGEKFKAGKLGEYTVGADGEIVLGPPTEFTAANIDKFNF
ncbi:monosaccharide ABC transporter substrate-binding protein (CUT2 family) [Kribbella sp. VKM Ac-2569]|uniref:rhamnose ABC transporter substrate-binding protein n=1 Tax=Kribbella sp. VKM Ac-2569 TaxID=2512220 RepID=UPI00102B74D9|nr:rhamnose ABC transporter substrate-binding protein [Kribbella sp. VKM Ac-2569]RZT15014.1 monosaccharide ABC transporter substrate-binding protein (CUT2 family) [Kribbella sp. VKM Ac-2569]